MSLSLIHIWEIELVGAKVLITVYGDGGVEKVLGVGKGVGLGVD